MRCGRIRHSYKTKSKDKRSFLPTTYGAKTYEKPYGLYTTQLTQRHLNKSNAMATSAFLVQPNAFNKSQ